nr:MAG TPA: hypothetical protein [Caudoviricetes sp.]
MWYQNLKMDYRNSYRQSIIGHFVSNIMGNSECLGYTRGEYPHPMPMVEDQLTYIMSLLEKRQQAVIKCEKLERLFEKNNLHPRTTGKDISHLTMKLGLAHVAVTGYNFMIEHYVLKMVKEMPIKPCKFKAIVRKTTSNLVYKDCLPRDIPENPVLRALDAWVVGFKKAHDIE